MATARIVDERRSKFPVALAAIMGFGAGATLAEDGNEETDVAVSPIAIARRNSMRKQKKHYPYVIVGAGTTAHAAIEAIRQHEPNAEILLLSDEATLPRVDADWRKQDGLLAPISDALLVSIYHCYILLLLKRARTPTMNGDVM